MPPSPSSTPGRPGHWITTSSPQSQGQSQNLPPQNPKGEWARWGWWRWGGLEPVRVPASLSGAPAVCGISGGLGLPEAPRGKGVLARVWAWREKRWSISDIYWERTVRHSISRETTWGCVSSSALQALVSVAAEAEAPVPPWAPVTLTSWAFEVETSMMPAIWMLPRESSLRSRNPEDGFRRSRITSL